MRGRCTYKISWPITRHKDSLEIPLKRRILKNIEFLVAFICYCDDAFFSIISSGRSRRTFSLPMRGAAQRVPPVLLAAMHVKLPGPSGRQ